MNATTIPTEHQIRLNAGAACREAALKYISLGIAPLLLCDPQHVGVATFSKHHASRCDSPGKGVMVRWKEFQERLPTKGEVNRWFGQYPIGNVGAVCGQASGTVRIDADGENGERLLLAWSGGDLPDTWMFRTPASPPQRLYRWPREIPCQSTSQKGGGKHQELRLMGNGEQTVLPPSRHPAGGFYEWLEGYGPNDIKLAPAPQWLIERMKANGGYAAATVSLPDQLPDVDIEALNVSDEIKRLILNGAPAESNGRGPTLYKVELALMRAGYDDATIAAVILNPRYGISSKPLQKGERWTEMELARARGDSQTWHRWNARTANCAKPYLWDIRAGAITGPTWNIREGALTGKDIGVWH